MADSPCQRNHCGGSLRDRIFQSERKIKGFQLLLEELAQPEVDVAEISHHTTRVMNMIRQQNLLMIPRILEQIRKQSEPLVLEISRKKQTKRLEKVGGRGHGRAAGKPKEDVNVGEYLPAVMSAVSSESSLDHGTVVSAECQFAGAGVVKVNEEEPVVDPPLMRNVESEGEKQFEIIFSDSTRQADVDNGNHIIHSITERTLTAAEDSGTVNVPNSFPLFQLVHTGEVPEDMQEEIVKLIRQANPQLDLNSITFNFKSPQTVEIIANINT